MNIDLMTSEEIMQYLAKRSCGFIGVYDDQNGEIQVYLKGHNFVDNLNAIHACIEESIENGQIELE